MRKHAEGNTLVRVCAADHCRRQDAGIRAATLAAALDYE